MDSISSVTGTNGCSLNSSLKGSDLPELFSKLGLGKYTDVFQQQEVILILNQLFITQAFIVFPGLTVGVEVWVYQTITSVQSEISLSLFVVAMLHS